MSTLDQPKKPSLLLRFTLALLNILFPFVAMWRLNGQLKKAQKIYSHSWFSRQRHRNTFIGLLATAPFILVVSLAGFLLYKDPIFLAKLSEAQSLFLDIKIGKAIDSFMYAFQNEKTAARISVLNPILLTGLITTLILGVFVRYKHPLIEKTKQLYKDLQRSGVIEKEEKNRLVLYTPLGCLVDVKGSTPKAVKEDTRIWTGLNIKIKDFSEDPDKISLVFFKKTYELKNKYIYNIR